MRVLLVINSLSTGGAEVFTASLARALRRQGCDIILFLYAGVLDEKGAHLARQLRSAGVQVITPNARSLTTKVLAVFKFAWLLFQFKPDVVHSHLEQSDLMVALAGLFIARRRMRRVRTIHNVYAMRGIPSGVHQWLAARFDVSVACGEVVSREYPFMGDNRRCIENGVDVDGIKRDDARLLRQQLQVDEGRRFLVCVGSFDLRNGILQKAQDVVVEALARLESEAVYVCFLGDGQQRAWVEAQAKSLGVADQCCFAGKVVDVYRYLSAADVVLIPSRFEGLPIGAIEAACAGKPLVLSSIPQLLPFESQATTVAQVDDPDAMALAIDEMLRDLDACTLEASRLAPGFIERFGIDTTARRYMQLYCETDSHHATHRQCNA